MRIGNKRFAMFCAAFLLPGISHVALAQENFGFVEPHASRTEGHPPEAGYAVIRGADTRALPHRDEVERGCSSQYLLSLLSPRPQKIIFFPSAWK
jgi:hypothetical protein